MSLMFFFFFFFFNDTATPEIYTLSLHDALPILIDLIRTSSTSPGSAPSTKIGPVRMCPPGPLFEGAEPGDRKSTRLNSSHTVISYAVFCLKKKKRKFKKI